MNDDTDETKTEPEAPLTFRGEPISAFAREDANEPSRAGSGGNGDEGDDADGDSDGDEPSEPTALAPSIFYSTAVWLLLSFVAMLNDQTWGFMWASLLALLGILAKPDLLKNRWLRWIDERAQKRVNARRQHRTRRWRWILRALEKFDAVLTVTARAGLMLLIVGVILWLVDDRLQPVIGVGLGLFGSAVVIGLAAVLPVNMLLQAAADHDQRDPRIVPAAEVADWLTSHEDVNDFLKLVVGVITVGSALVKAAI